MKQIKLWMLAAILTICGTAALLNAPFTHGEIGVLMRKGQDDLLTLVNGVICSGIGYF